MANVLDGPSIRVMVIDDEALVRSGFEMVLGVADDIEVIGTADGGTALQRIEELRPDVVLLDIRMPGRNGLEVLRDVRAMPGYDPVVAILTTFDTDDYIAQALGLGASGFLVKDTDPVQLPALVRSLAAGGVVLSPQVNKTVVTRFLSSTDRDAVRMVDELTDRERDVLEQLANGLSNTEIGGELYLSLGTVKDHVSAIFGKLRVTTRLQAALIAQRAGLLE